MAVRLKDDVLGRLKIVGYNTNKLRQEKLLGQSVIQKIRIGKVVLPSYIDTICNLLNCQPGDILEYIPDEPPTTINKPVTTPIANAVPDSLEKADSDVSTNIEPTPTPPIQNKLHATMLKEHANKPVSDAPTIDYKSDEHLRNKFEWVLSDEEIKEATPEWESWQGSNKARYLLALNIRGYIKEAKETDEEPNLPLSVRMAQDGRLQATAKEMEKDREVNVEEVSKVRVKFR